MISRKSFIDDICAENDSGEFGRSIGDMYPKELQLNVEHQIDYATFLNLYISIKDQS